MLGKRVEKQFFRAEKMAFDRFPRAINPVAVRRSCGDAIDPDRPGVAFSSHKRDLISFPQRQLPICEQAEGDSLGNF